MYKSVGVQLSVSYRFQLTGFKHGTIVLFLKGFPERGEQDGGWQ